MQSLVDADRAGVLFTRHPVTGPDERVIEASWGLGEAVVAGLVTPDHLRVGRDGVVRELRVGDKDVALRRRQDGGTEEVAIEPERAGAPCLDDADLRRLLRLADRCETLAPGPHDLEWALTAGGDPYLLQQRPMPTS